MPVAEALLDGAHQNLTFPVYPDPMSGQYRWLELTRPAGEVSPDGTRRPYGCSARSSPPGRSTALLEPADTSVGT